MKTIINLFEESVNKFSNNTYLLEKINDKYEPATYIKVREQVYIFAAGLISLGINKGDRIALLSEGRNAWVISELGILYAGGVNVPLSVKLDELSELKFRIEHSETKYIIVSKNHIHKIRKLINQLTNVEKVIALDDINLENVKEIHFSEINKYGNEYLTNNRTSFDERWQSVNENDYANICYTSGTTADPKGIILSHRNYTANVEQACSLMKIEEHFRTLLILPWDHSFAHTAGIYAFMAYGASIASIQVGNTPTETIKNIPINIKEVKPYVLMSVPALAKNFKKNIENGIKAKGPKVEKLFNKALKVAYKYNGDGWSKGKGFQLFNKIMYAIYDKIIFSKIREGFGGNLQFFIGGGALLDIELQKFFYALKMPMFQGYGLSEASPIISANSTKKHKMGTSGFLVKNLELKICDEKGNSLPVGEKGEIVVKGENVMKGYWKNEKATSETLKKGWLYTGDMGYLDNDGFLYVSGRFKSLLISNDGEKYSPEGIEEAIVENSKFIAQCILYNNQNPYTVVLIVPNKAAIISELEKNNLSLKNIDGQKFAINIIQKELDEYKNEGKYPDMFPQRWLPATFAIINEPFTEENHFMNSTLKMVRGKITEHYKGIIEFLYTPDGKNINNEQNYNNININQKPETRNSNYLCNSFFMAKKKKKSKKRFILKIVLSVFLLLLIVGGITGYSYYKKIYYPNIKTTNSKIYLYIPTGSNFNDLLKILSENGILSDVSSFEWLAEQKNYTNHIKPGKYKLNNNMSNNELINLLRAGKQEPVNVVIRGFRTKEELAQKIGNNLEADSCSVMDLLNSNSFSNEYGFNKENILVLFIPNTYEFYWNTSAEDFFSRMAKEYKTFWTNERQQQANDARMTQTEVSILASIVQQETYKADEMPVIAGVYVNRLHKGIRLQADPTVIFAVGDYTIRRVLKKHLEYDSPYNTYLHEGLPPGPICIPWQKSIDAVLNYKKHPYIYFCAKEDFSGYHNFAKTGAEHQKNAAKYQNALNKRNIK